MMEDRLLALLESILGKSYKKSKDNYAFYSPFVSHRKPKLEITLSLNSKGENLWHCWISDERGRSIQSLFKKLGVSKSNWDEHNAIFKNKYKYDSNEVQTDVVFLRLPDEYIPIWHPSTSIIRTHAITYLLKRGVSVSDMIRYGIGYCEEGEYKNKLIIPSYNSDGILNFFIGRGFYKEFNPHKKPSVSSDVIGFDLFINWDDAIILCEGAFDAMAIKRNAIPLFGKFIQNNLKLKIIEKQVSEIYIILDSDALKSSLKIAEDLQNEGIKVHLIDIKDGDPAELGFKKINEMIQQSKEFSFADLVRYKLMEI